MTNSKISQTGVETKVSAKISLPKADKTPKAKATTSKKEKVTKNVADVVENVKDFKEKVQDLKEKEEVEIEPELSVSELASLARSMNLR